MGVEFRWSKDKADTNLLKHGITFELATTVFFNPLSVTAADEEHSIDEDRELIVGHAGNGELLVVVYAEMDEALIRIISARRASKRERRQYEEQN